ncbi:hypothetical protein [Methanoplanus limicola]|uniref:Uncharacterized protein n=1 Tax=Methanoplanus limicola DSM 2279 TaxID=937775 RepID=H1YZC2_9EURY|nr:hypothetical protein [Methanoplanus limicola]EHQ35146.1 hypothetical protein Metlim_1027 [Methanoplanus limicola DSM 2279]
MKKLQKALLALLIVVVILASGLMLFLHLLSGDLGGSMSLAKVSKENLAHYEIVEITDDDFNKYPSLRELFENINGDGGEFISHASVRGRATDEIMSKYSVETDGQGKHIRKALFWNGDYYCILMARS